MLFNKERSFVNCTIKDSKLQKEEQEKRDSCSLKGLCLFSIKHFMLWWGEVGRGPLSENHLICRLQGLDNSFSCAEAFVYIKGSYQLYKLGIYLDINLWTDQSNDGSSQVLCLFCLYAGLTYSIVLTIVHFDGTPSYPSTVVVVII